MIGDLEIAWFLGAPGLILGAIAGTMIGRSSRGAGAAVSAGVLIGLAAGILLDLIIVHDVETSTSSTAAIGLLLVPFPPLMNVATAVGATVIARRIAENGATGGANRP